MDKIPNHIELLPFEELLQELKEQYHFVLGVDSHERINRLLNRYANSEQPDATRLQYQLCSILATSQEEQDIFDRTYQEFLDRHSYEFESILDDPSYHIDQQVRRSRWLFRGLSALFLLISLYLYLSFVYVKPQPAPVAAQLPGSYHLFLADSSVIRDLPPFFRDKIKTRKWAFENKKQHEATPYTVATFKEPHTDQIELEITSRGKRKATRAFTPGFQRPLRLRITERKLGDSLLFIPQIRKIKPEIEAWPKKLQKAYKDVAKAYRLLGRTYRWTLSNGEQFDQSELLLPSPEQEIEIRLSITEVWQIPGDTLHWSAEAKTDIGPPHPAAEIPLVPIRYKKLDGPDIDQVKALLQVNRPNYLPLYLLLLGSILYLLYEWYRLRRRKLILEPAKKIGSPLRIDLEIEPSGWPKFDDPIQEEALLALRIRQLGLGETLNIPETLQATLEAGAIPSFRFHARSQAPQYLFLIAEKSSRDHQALYFGAWAAEMNRRDINAECYFYRRSPQKCWRSYKDRDSHRSLTQLLSAYGDYRIVIVGEAKGLFDLRSGKPGAVMQLLDSTQKKALLSAEPTSQWGPVERAVEAFMPVLPANSEGLLQLSHIWSKDNSLPKLSAKTLLDPEPPMLPADPAEEEEADWKAILEELRPYLGKRGMQWLAACALYPEIEWELTLNMGRTMGFYYDETIGLRLFRLPWFRQGELPEGLRVALFDELSEQQRTDGLAYLTSLLSHRENMPPTDSMAEQERRSQMAVYRFLNSDRGPQAKTALQQVIGSLPPEEIQDKVILKGLETAAKDSFFSKLPKQILRKNSAYFGLHRKSRLMAFSIAFVLGVFWILFNGNLLGPQLPQEPYNNNMLRVNLVAKDSLVWAHYRASQAADTGNYIGAVNILDRRAAAYLNSPQYDERESNELAPDHSRSMFNLLLAERNDIAEGLQPPFGVDSKALSKFAYTYATLTDPAYREKQGIASVPLTDWKNYLMQVPANEFADNRWLLANSYVYYGDDWDVMIVNASENQADGYISPFLDFQALLDSNYFTPATTQNAFFETGAKGQDSLLALLDYLESQVVNPEEHRTIDSIRTSLGQALPERCQGIFVIEGHTRDLKEGKPIDQNERLGNVTISWGGGAVETESSSGGLFKLEIDTCMYPLSDYKLELSRQGYQDTTWNLVSDNSFYETGLTSTTSIIDRLKDLLKDHNTMGRITLISSGNKGVEKAQVAEIGVVSTMTDKNGDFELTYDDPKEKRKIGDRVRLSVTKEGFEVVNIEALDVKIGQRTVRLLMAREGYIDSLKDVYLSSMMSEIDTEYERKVKSVRIDKDLNDYDVKVRTEMVDRVRNNKEKEAEEIARDLANTNLDQVSRKKFYAIEALQKGDASQVMDFFKEDYTDTPDYIKQEAAPSKGQQQKKAPEASIAEREFNNAKNELSRRNYVGAMKSFNQAIAADPENIDYYLDFGALLEKANQEKDAKSVYKKGIQSDNPTIEDHQRLADRLSELHANPKSGKPSYINAIYVQKTFLKALKDVQSQNPEKYDLMFVESTLRIAAYYQSIPRARDIEYVGLLRSSRRLVEKHPKNARYQAYKVKLEEYWAKYGGKDAKGN